MDKYKEEIKQKLSECFFLPTSHIKHENETWFVKLFIHKNVPERLLWIPLSEELIERITKEITDAEQGVVN